MNPLQLGFYKGMGGQWGAAQFGLQKPHYYVKNNPKLKNYEGKFIPDAWKETDPDLTRDDLASREGALFLEISSAIGKNEYDWTNKIVMALSVFDMGKLLLVLEGNTSEVKIYHDPGAKSASAGKIQKTLVVSSPKGLGVGVTLVATQSEAGGGKRQHTVPLGPEDVKLLGSCIRGVIPATLAWT